MRYLLRKIRRKNHPSLSRRLIRTGETGRDQLIRASWPATSIDHRRNATTRLAATIRTYRLLRMRCRRTAGGPHSASSGVAQSTPSLRSICRYGCAMSTTPMTVTGRSSTEASRECARAEALVAGPLRGSCAAHPRRSVTAASSTLSSLVRAIRTRRSTGSLMSSAGRWPGRRRAA